MKKFKITDIILANGSKQEPKKVNIVVSDINEYRKIVKQENPHYDVLFIYEEVK